MFYHYLRFLNYLFIVSGIRKPFVVSTEKSKTFVGYKIWSLIVIACMILGYIATNREHDNLSLKNIITIYRMNDLVVNILVIVLNFVNGQKVCAALYRGIENILKNIYLTEMNLKMFCTKMYLIFFATTLPVAAFIVFELISDNSCMLLITFPTYLSAFHLVLHLILILAILKLVTLKMFDALNNEYKHLENNYIEEPKLYSKLKYTLSTDVKFFQVNVKDHFDLKYLCKMYDDLSTSIQLLEQHHSVQMLLAFWLMFSNGVFGITIIVCDQVRTEKVLIIAARSTMPFLWCFIGSFINNQMNREVDKIEMIIIKFLIDFRCDQSRKDILQTFKQLIVTNHLQFSVSSLFKLSYSTILGTIVNVITYSIIMIQLFMNNPGDVKKVRH